MDQKTNSLRVGLYGGSFDPIHNAHLIIAEFIREDLGLDKVIFIPSGIPPHKEVYSSKELRLKMVRLSIKDHPAFECSEIELARPDVNYTIDTVKQLSDDLGVPGENLFWIIGSDNFVDFPKWKNPEGILQLCQVVVFPRHYDDFDKTSVEWRSHPAIILVKAPVLEISSTLVRSFVRQGRSIRYLAPPPVQSIIKTEKLYL